MMEKIIMDDTYGENIRDPRLYFEFSPTLRTGGAEGNRGDL